MIVGGAAPLFPQDVHNHATNETLFKRSCFVSILLRRAFLRGSLTIKTEDNRKTTGETFMHKRAGRFYRPVCYNAVISWSRTKQTIVIVKKSTPLIPSYPRLRHGQSLRHHRRSLLTFTKSERFLAITPD